MTQTLINKKAVSEKYSELYQVNRSTLDQGSSPVLNRMRDIAIKRFEQQGVPGFKNEDYKYTNLERVFGKEYRHIFEYEKVDVDLNEVFRCDVPQLDTYTILLVNGWYYARNKQLEGLPDGVVVGSLKQVANEQPELLENYLNRQAALSDDPLVALNTAFAQDGFFMYVPENVKFEKPVQVINLTRAQEAVFSTQRNLIIAGANSEAKVIFCDHTLTSSECLGNSVTEVFVGDRAVVDVYAVQNQNNKSNAINSVFFKLGEKSNLMSGVASLHGGLIRNNLLVSMDGENAEANVYGMSFTDKRQHVDNYTNIQHNQANCLSNQLYKNVLDEDSVGAFTGRIHVARDAQKTNAFQRNNNVLLTDTAKMNTKPQLIIDADDVKCSHGATVGQIDLDALFYMRQRGIGEADARMMLMNAFAHEVVQEIRIEPLRDRIDELVEKRLKGELGKCNNCDA
ncbi:Fe-S cluster assembly protein SufD [Mangrovibacterium marinum]|uniref:Fe-S cluster assembly protein SufD n=1 Tax=Mangrovibacterium marinum TaxID=1639118 RepID=A0A2T5BYI7_9BACT|nr:Fe-S cluster assembly protein SufD [Mangrovibacterium marinum]PTN07316.1 Fe-S cluster assembly protein SufD [Mangrovibacterium marinum]